MSTDSKNVKKSRQISSWRYRSFSTFRRDINLLKSSEGSSLTISKARVSFISNGRVSERAISLKPK